MRLASEQVDEPDDRDDDYSPEDRAADEGDRAYHEWASGEWEHLPPSERPPAVRRVAEIVRRLDELHRRHADAD